LREGTPLAAGAGNALAGITVALVLVPQALAYATLAGLPPENGLFAAALVPAAAAVFASSPYLQTGPTALTALLTLGALTAVAEPFSAEYIGLAALLAVLVGVVRLATGLLRAGIIAYLMSHVAVLGFMSAAVVLIIASQLPAILGVEAPAGNPLVGAWMALSRPSDWSLSALGFAGLAVTCIVVGRRIHPLAPGAIIAVVTAVLLSQITGYGGHIVGTLPASVVPLSLQLPWAATPALLLPAVIIALVGFAEPAAIARRYATEERRAWDPNRELLSQGIANVVAGASGGLPVGGSFSRTALNRRAGARSQWSAVVTSLVVLAFLPAASLLAGLPTAVLAMIVIVSVLSLVDVRAVHQYWRLSRTQTLVGVVTFGATLALAPRVELGVLIGIGAAIVAHLWREQRLSLQEWREGDTLHLRPRGVLFFVSSPALEDLFTVALGRHRDAQRIQLHLDDLGRVDLTGAMGIGRFISEARAAGLEVSVVDVPTQALAIVTRVLGDLVPVRAARDADDTEGRR
jgi:sulfate permease, SulP family